MATDPDSTRESQLVTPQSARDGAVDETQMVYQTDVAAPEASQRNNNMMALAQQCLMAMTLEQVKEMYITVTNRGTADDLDEVSKEDMIEVIVERQTGAVKTPSVDGDIDALLDEMATPQGDSDNEVVATMRPTKVTPRGALPRIRGGTRSGTAAATEDAIVDTIAVNVQQARQQMEQQLEKERQENDAKNKAREEKLKELQKQMEQVQKDMAEMKTRENEEKAAETEKGLNKDAPAFQPRPGKTAVRQVLFNNPTAKLRGGLSGVRSTASQTRATSTTSQTVVMSTRSFSARAFTFETEDLGNRGAPTGGIDVTGGMTSILHKITAVQDPVTGERIPIPNKLLGIFNYPTPGDIMDVPPQDVMRPSIDVGDEVEERRDALKAMVFTVQLGVSELQNRIWFDQAEHICFSRSVDWWKLKEVKRSIVGDPREKLLMLEPKLRGLTIVQQIAVILCEMMIFCGHLGEAYLAAISELETISLKLTENWMEEVERGCLIKRDFWIYHGLFEFVNKVDNC